MFSVAEQRNSFESRVIWIFFSPHCKEEIRDEKPMNRGDGEPIGERRRQ